MAEKARIAQIRDSADPGGNDQIAIRWELEDGSSIWKNLAMVEPSGEEPLPRGRRLHAKIYLTDLLRQLVGQDFDVRVGPNSFNGKPEVFLPRPQRQQNGSQPEPFNGTDTNGSTTDNFKAAFSAEEVQ